MNYAAIKPRRSYVDMAWDEAGKGNVAGVERLLTLAVREDDPHYSPGLWGEFLLEAAKKELDGFLRAGEPDMEKLYLALERHDEIAGREGVRLSDAKDYVSLRDRLTLMVPDEPGSADV